MRVKCLNCGFTYDIEGKGEEMCPECGCRHWHTRFTEYEKLHDEPEEEKIKDEEDWERGKKELLKACGMDPKLLGKSNIKSAQEVQREQCKGKTIVEILNNEWREK